MKKQIRTETMNIGMVGVRAAILPDSINLEARTIEAVFATDSPVTRYGWDGKWIERLSLDPTHVRMDRLNNGVVPMLDNHNSWSGTGGVLGSVRDVRFENGKAICTLSFASTPDVENTWKKVSEGHIRGVSVGYRVHKYEEQVAETKAGPNADRSTEMPEYLATDWEPMEVSIAPIPADFNSATRSAEQDNHQVTIIRNNNSDNNIMKREQIIAMLQERGISFDANCTDEELMAVLGRSINAPAPPAQPAPAPAPAPAAEGEETVRTAERSRVKEITTICRAAGFDQTKIDEYIDKGTSLEAVRAAVLKHYQENDPNSGAAPGVSVGRDRDTEGRRNAMAEALVLRSGAIGGFKPTVDMAMVQEYRAMKLVDMAKVALGVLGVDTRGMDDMEVVKRAITSSSSDFPVILEGTNRRILLAAYESIADTWRQFCSVGSVSDFREYKRVKMGSMFTRLDQVNENGEYKTKAITDGKQESISVDTYGNIINVTRKMIVNDDLSAFTRLAANLGRAAARSIELDVYARLAENSGAGPTMADGNPLFHSSHNNISTAAALSMDALDADRIKMAQQKDIDGNDYLDLRPSVLLLPIGLGSAARTYNDAAYDPDSSGKFQKPNTVRGLFNTIVDTPRLTGTRRYLFADPNVAPVLEVAFLNGVQTPFMETEEAFTTDGMKWKIRHDYGVAAIDWQGAITNAGS